MKFALRIAADYDVKDILKAAIRERERCGSRDVCVVKKAVQGRGRAAFVMAEQFWSTVS